MTTTKRNGLFIIGAILLVLGAGTITFAPYFIYFYRLPIIVFIIGVVLIWFSSRTSKTKALWTLTPIPIFFIYQFLWRWTNTNEPETFLIPKSYRGRIHVLFDEDCGQIPEYENGRRVYHIPNNGILLTRFKDESGIINQEYYFVDSLGTRTSIPELDVRDYNEEWTAEKNLNEPSRDSLAVFHAGRSGSGTFEERNYVFQEVYIATYNQLSDTFDFKYERKADSIEYELIKDCRKE